MELFPLDPAARYDYSRAFSRKSGGHKGTDIFADRGTMVVAVEPGRARRAKDPRGGIVVYLEGDSGTRYYYAHLADVVPQLGARAKRVVTGALLGHVGSTGNAKGKPPHLHFQLSENGQVVDPFPLLVAVDPQRGFGAQTSKPKPKPKPKPKAEPEPKPQGSRSWGLGLFDFQLPEFAGPWQMAIAAAIALYLLSQTQGERR